MAGKKSVLRFIDCIDSEENGASMVQAYSRRTNQIVILTYKQPVSFMRPHLLFSCETRLRAQIYGENNANCGRTVGTTKQGMEC
jgi:hypothetical protein